MTTKHTPLPWTVQKQYHDDGHVPTNHLIPTGKNKHWENWIIGTIGNTAQDNKNAAFIVRACNSHYELLAALELVSNLPGFEAGEPYGIIVRNAIAKAKG